MNYSLKKSREKFFGEARKVFLKPSQKISQEKSFYIKNFISEKLIPSRDWFYDRDVDYLCDQLEELDSLKSLILVFQM